VEIDLLSVRQVFMDLLSGRLSREQADRWAHAVVQKAENDLLVFCPPGDRQRIWAGVMYLYGVDSRETPDVYLHSDEDIRAAMARIL
jgi:hypothetical protein